MKIEVNKGAASLERVYTFDEVIQRPGVYQFEKQSDDSLRRYRLIVVKPHEYFHTYENDIGMNKCHWQAYTFVQCQSPVILKFSND